MRTSNPKLLAEIDFLEDCSRLESSELEVVRCIDKLTQQRDELMKALEHILKMNFPPEYYEVEDCAALDNAEHLLTKIKEQS